MQLLGDFVRRQVFCPGHHWGFTSIDSLPIGSTNFVTLPASLTIEQNFVCHRRQCTCDFLFFFYVPFIISCTYLPFDPPWPKTPCCVQTSCLLVSLELFPTELLRCGNTANFALHRCCDPISSMYEHYPYPLNMSPQTKNEHSTTPLCK